MNRRLCAALALSSVLVFPLSAQQRPLEFGLDVVGTRLSRSAGVITFGLNVPAGLFRAAVPLTDHTSVDGAFSFFFVGSQSVGAVTTQLILGLPYYLKPSSGRDGFFVRPRIGLVYFSADASDVGAREGQFNGGLNVGTKIPVLSHVSIRMGVEVTYWFENGSFQDALTGSGTFGFSVFTR